MARKKNDHKNIFTYILLTHVYAVKYEVGSTLCRILLKRFILQNILLVEHEPTKIGHISKNTPFCKIYRAISYQSKSSEAF